MEQQKREMARRVIKNNHGINETAQWYGVSASTVRRAMDEFTEWDKKPKYYIEHPRQTTVKDFNTGQIIFNAERYYLPTELTGAGRTQMATYRAIASVVAAALRSEAGE